MEATTGVKICLNLHMDITAVTDMQNNSPAPVHEEVKKNMLTIMIAMLIIC